MIRSDSARLGSELVFIIYLNDKPLSSSSPSPPHPPQQQQQLAQHQTLIHTSWLSVSKPARGSLRSHTDLDFTGLQYENHSDIGVFSKLTNRYDYSSFMFWTLLNHLKAIAWPRSAVPQTFTCVGYVPLLSRGPHSFQNCSLYSRVNSEMSSPSSTPRLRAPV